MSDINKESLQHNAAELNPKNTNQSPSYSFYEQLETQRANSSSFKEVNTAKCDLIKALKDVLGTMVQEPEFTSDPSNIGQKQFKMYIQRPILEGEKRTKVVDKLIQLVDSL